jgi:protein-S-isoprenylcysteine O-methyltransferase Ste14
MEQAMSTEAPPTPPQAEPTTRALVRRRAIQLGVFVAVQAAILFLGAGRLRWTGAWVYLVSYVGLIALTRLVIRDPELFAERARFRKDAKTWDKWLSAGFSVLGLGVLALAALDARFGWSAPQSPALAVAGFVFFLLGFGVSVWAMAANRFFSTFVRIQTDRGHTVATGGPYRFVRHPGYAGFILGGLGIPLLLGSLWALVPAALSCLVVLVRTELEDRTLREELPGYRDYALRVRARLVPRAW